MTTKLSHGKKLVQFALILSLLFGETIPVSAGEITTDEIMSASSSEDCMNWCVVGFCVWLRCSIYDCEVETTLRVRHGAPDLVVSVHNISGMTTWTDVREIAESATEAFEIGGGDNTDEEGGRHYDSILMFKEVALNGNPVSEVLSSIDTFCPTEVTPFFPYYTSEVDQFVWRTGIPEQVTHILDLDNIGDQSTIPLWTWGRVYPRHGWVNTEDDAHAAGAAAVRGADIVDTGGLRFVSTLDTPDSYGRRDVERLEHSRPFQRLSPNSQETCEVIGEDNSNDWGLAVRDTRYLNAWNYWHRYECCMEGSGAVIASFSTGECPGE